MTLENNTRKFKLALFWPEPDIPFSLGRAVGPFAAMSQEDDRFTYKLPQRLPGGGVEHSWDYLIDCDALYILNPIHDWQVNLVWLARNMGLPVWADWGDDIFNVHPSNPSYSSFIASDDMKKNVDCILALADIATVPSEACKTAFEGKLGTKSVKRLLVIGEACRWRKDTRPRTKTVSWRGMSSHEEDVMDVLPAIQAIAGAPEFSDWNWLLFGDPPRPLRRALGLALNEPCEGVESFSNKRLRIAPPLATPFHMFEAWSGQAPFLHICPLANVKFNLAKPPNAWMEATAAGAAVIAPDFLPDWREDGIIHYSDSVILHDGMKDFATVLRREMAAFQENGKQKTESGKEESIGALHPKAVESQAAVFPALTLDSVNQKRWACIRKMQGLKSTVHSPQTELKLEVVK